MQVREPAVIVSTTRPLRNSALRAQLAELGRYKAIAGADTLKTYAGPLRIGRKSSSLSKRCHT